jgi:hypothetical protein
MAADWLIDIYKSDIQLHVKYSLSLSKYFYFW